jgi:hypothetical protein
MKGEQHVRRRLAARELQNSVGLLDLASLNRPFRDTHSSYMSKAALREFGFRLIQLNFFE